MSNPESSPGAIGIVGYGEVGKIFGAALARRTDTEPRVWDTNFADPNRSDGERAHAGGAGLRPCRSCAELTRSSRVIFSVVTAGSTRQVVEEAAPHLTAEAVFLDLNSASPGTKAACFDTIEANGGRYVESAIMSAVPAHGLRVPILLGGPRAAEVAPMLLDLGMRVTAVTDRIGVVSATKMCRSVVVKGLEALVVESLTAARAFGVEDAVLESLAETFPEIEWEARTYSFFQRIAGHGERRAEEMLESARTVSEVAIGDFMAAAAAQRQQWMADLGRRGAFDAPSDGWRPIADALLRLSRED